MHVSIVIPIYNEEENVSPVYEKLTDVMRELNKEYEIIFVDDGSTDGSFPILQKIQSEDEHVVVLGLRKNFGQTAAIAAGFDFARGEVIVTMDGDLQNDPSDIPEMLNLIKECDLVSGWRKNRKDAFISRKIPSLLANWLISKVTGVKLHDFGCTLKAYRSEIAKNLRLYGEMHRFIPALASWYGISVREVKVKHHRRLKGKSKYGISRTTRVLLDLITVKFLQSFSTRPVQFFGPMGLILGLLGILISAYLSVEKLFFGQPIGDRPLLLLGVLFIIVGIQLLGMGLLGELITRVYHESQKKPIYLIRQVLASLGKSNN